MTRQEAQMEREPENSGDRWVLKLYVAGQTARSAAALENLRSICEDHMGGRYTIEVVDLAQNPRLARTDQIVAVPTLVRKLPQPMRKIIGDLSNKDRVIVGLSLDSTQRA